MHIILFLLIMIIIVSVIFIPIIHKSVTADIAAIEAMALNDETMHPDIDVAPGLKTETLIAVYVILALCPSIFLMGLYPRFRQPVSVETIPVSYESGEEIPKNVTVIVDEENSTHFESTTYKWGFLYEKETVLHVNLSDDVIESQQRQQ